MKKLVLGITLSVLVSISADACTRALYVGNDLVITGRAQDWYEELQTDLWVFPRGMKRNGEVGP